MRYLRSALRLVLTAMLLGGATLGSPQAAQASHFRYGNITWRTVNKATNTVQFRVTAAFRRSQSSESPFAYPGSAPDGYLAVGDTFTEFIGPSAFGFGDNTQLTGPGNTGNIQITAGNQFAMTNSTVTTEATQSGGGAIKITTNPNGTVQLTNSTISASVLNGTGGGGSVNIDPQYVVLQNSQILAQAVQGPGGNINITTNLLLPDSTSLISASSQFGQQGTVMIQSPISPASGKIVPLGQKPLLSTHEGPLSSPRIWSWASSARLMPAPASRATPC